MSFGYKLITIEPLEVKVFMMTETSDSMSDADFWGSKKVEKTFKMVFLKKLLYLIQMCLMIRNNF